MRTSPSPPKHNLARLRSLLRLGQKEMADLAGYSTSAIQRIELGKLELSGALAQRISNATAINPYWLLENDLKAPFVSDHYKPFTIKDYKQRRSDRERGIIAPTYARELRTMAFYAWMRAIFATKDGNVALHETGKFLEKLAKRYGHNQSILRAPRIEVTALRDIRLLRRHADMGARFVTEKCKDVWQWEDVHGLMFRLSQKEITE